MKKHENHWLAVQLMAASLPSHSVIEENNLMEHSRHAMEGVAPQQQASN